MKYTIHGLQQDKLIKLGLNNDDALILSVLKDRYSSMKMEYKIISNQRYIWINYTNLLENDIPILSSGKSKSNLMAKIKKYEELGLIKRKLLYDKDGKKGNFAYICLTEKFDYLTEYEKEPANNDKQIPCPEFGQPLSKNKITLIQNSDNKDYSIIDYPTIDNSSSSDAENNKKNDDDVIKPDLEFSEKNSTKEDEIKERIEKKIGEIQQSGFKKLLKHSDLETITYYLDNWKKFDSVNMSSEVGFFIDACIKKYPFPKSKKGTVNNQPIQATNYEQREYDDEFYDSLYNNLEYIK